ncbi:hypothetical protein KR009_006666 [Drosophila setifemur]|nr:hypothetical protein KR009_006666 [Drosophila setifemur]
MHATKIFFVLGLILAVAYAGIPGGKSPLEGDKLKEATALLTSSLAKLATGDGPNYQVVKVKSATTQVVAGSLKEFVVELSNGTDHKDCTVKIWEQPWLTENATNLKIKCGDEGEIEKSW